MQCRSPVNDMLLTTSYVVNKTIAMSGETQTIAENFIKPCILNIVSVMLN